MPNLAQYEFVYPALSLLGAGLICFGIIVVFLRLERSSARMVGAGLVSLLFGTIVVGATMQEAKKTIPPIPALTKARW